MLLFTINHMHITIKNNLSIIKIVGFVSRLNKLGTVSYGHLFLNFYTNKWVFIELGGATGSILQAFINRCHFQICFDIRRQMALKFYCSERSWATGYYCYSSIDVGFKYKGFSWSYLNTKPKTNLKLLINHKNVSLKFKAEISATF